MISCKEFVTDHGVT